MIQNKNRNTRLILLCSLLAMFSIAYYFYCPLVFDRTSQSRLNFSNRFSKGDSFNPFLDFNFSNGDWELFIVENEKNRSLLFGSKVLRSSDTTVLNLIKTNWQLRYTDSDAATVNSKLLLFKNKELMFTCNVSTNVINPGLQSVNFGWVEFNDQDKFREVFDKMEKGHKPVYLFSGTYAPH